jgi:hypothetical protein
MANLIRATTPILKVVIIGIFIVGFGLAVLGVILVYLGSTGDTKFAFFGQTFSSTSVGIPAIFIGSTAIVLLVRRALKSLDVVTAKETNSGDLHDDVDMLEITHVGFTKESEFDITVRNLGKNAIVINQIAITMLKNHHNEVWPVLSPTARYVIPVDDLEEGETRTQEIAHVVDGNKADRFFVALETTKIYTLKVTLRYNRDKEISFRKRTWPRISNGEV